MGTIASVPVSERMMGRVIDPLGNPIDGKGPIPGPVFDMPLERKARELYSGNLCLNRCKRVSNL